MEFIQFFSYQFAQKALVAGLMISVIGAVIGLFLVLRRLSLIGDGLSHVSFGAVALALFLGIAPLYAALPIALASSYFILRLSSRSRISGDAAVGIVSSVGVAAGIILASLGGGFNIDLQSYLFGNILAISDSEIWLSSILSVVVAAVLAFCYRDLARAAFDEEYAQLSGVRTKRLQVVLSCLAAVFVVLAIKVAGVMLVSALLIMPAASALNIARSFKSALISSIAIAITALILGLLFSFKYDWPSGATIVMANFFIFILSYILEFCRSK